MLAGFQQKFTFAFEGEEFLRQMNDGGLLVSAHVGNWEIAGQLLNRLDKRINIILFDAEHQQIKGYLSDVMKSRNVHFIVIRDDFNHLLEIKAALANKEIVAMHGDRHIEGNRTMIMDFMGKPAAFPIGPLNMAAKFRVPVSFVFAVKETNRHYHFYATPLQTVGFTTNLKQREENFRATLSVYVRKFEEILLKYPTQWFNYYDFWKLPETGINATKI
jgi:predicted LPLAT superfamily acyltransferase